MSGTAYGVLCSLFHFMCVTYLTLFICTYIIILVLKDERSYYYHVACSTFLSTVSKTMLAAICLITDTQHHSKRILGCDLLDKPTRVINFLTPGRELLFIVIFFSCFQVITGHSSWWHHLQS